LPIAFSFWQLFLSCIGSKKLLLNFVFSSESIKFF
jgi:hypothetical protein